MQLFQLIHTMPTVSFVCELSDRVTAEKIKSIVS